MSKLGPQYIMYDAVVHGVLRSLVVAMQVGCYTEKGGSGPGILHRNHNGIPRREGRGQSKNALSKVVRAFYNLLTCLCHSSDLPA